MTPKFKVGDEVQSISDPNRIGTIIEISDFHAGVQFYRVNFGTPQRPIISESDLRPFSPETTPCDNLSQGKIDSYQEFQRLMTQQRLLRDFPLRNNIYAFNASRTLFFPYQFKPLLKFLDSPKHRLLIADEVGLGKTIEAGLILTEMRARQSIERVLVVCPANLTKKWQVELKNRFGEKFEILTAPKFDIFLQDYARSTYGLPLNGIISLESIRQQRILEKIDIVAPDFDLVIFDEAHHMRNIGRKQRKAGVLLSESSEAILFLTATPIHLGNKDLFSLLNILDDEEFPDEYTAEERFRSNVPIVYSQIHMGQLPPLADKANKLLREMKSSPYVRKNPLYPEVLRKLKELNNPNLVSEEQRKLTIAIQHDLADLNLLGRIFNRTKKRDVLTNFIKRHPYTPKIILTDIERQFYDAVTDYVLDEASKKHHSKFIERWILHMPQRRMASSIPAMVDYYRQKFHFSKEDLDEDVGFIDESIESENDKFEFASAEERLQHILKIWPQNGLDSKYEKFKEILTCLRKNETHIKIMVFSFFKATLKYLNQRLHKDGFNSMIISGDVKQKDRTEIVEKFRTDRSLEILLSSKVGSEGLDFQFCDTLFNYDLPWNPMEVEQRIGRLDRIGQESDVIRIYNFFYEDSIEERILKRLYDRIGIFESSIGELEMILGVVLSSLEDEVFRKKLSKKEEEELLERKLRAFENRKKEIKTLENKAAEFIGTDQYFNEEVKMIQEKRRYITGEQMRRFIIDFIRFNCPRTIFTYDLEKKAGEIKPDNTMRNILSTYDKSGDLSRLLFYTADKITFESQTAYDNPNFQFINVLHPLPQAIAAFYAEKEIMHSNCHHIVLETKKLKPGYYLYFIYRLRIIAAQSRNTLEIVILDQNLKKPISDEDMEILLGEMVEIGQDSKGSGYQLDRFWAERACQQARSIFLKKRESIREEVERNNDAFINLRLESLRTSYEKNIKTKKDLLKRAKRGKKSEQYIRMLIGTINKLEQELTNIQSNLEKLRIMGVEHDEIATGILEVI
jgi:SNF2 family DNA or RNA helicase